MFNRNIIAELDIWAAKQDRKPLILRGARQVGKTSAINLFAQKFDKYIYLNLDRLEDLALFRQNSPFQDVVDSIFFAKNVEKKAGKILLFIDEIQNSAKAVSLLRYFYEDTPELFVVAAGSLLETLIDNQISFPVGRVEYLAVHPCSFEEFLTATSELQALEILKQNLVPEFAHDKLTGLFRQYAIIGGMPEIVKNYAENRDLTKLKTLYDGLIVSYLDDVEKYARNSSMIHVVRFIIENAFSLAGERITFEGFSNSNFRSREMGEAFRLLEKTMLLQMVYPVVNTGLPVNIKNRSPKLQLLDTGLVNYKAGIQGELLGSTNIEDVYRGKIAEHITGQELLSSENSVLARLNYWIRDTKNAQAEVDFVISFNGILIPIEVKSGATGKLRSLHRFMDEAPHHWAVRVYSGKLSIENATTLAGKAYKLINIPFYLTGRLVNVLAAIIK